MGVWYATRDEFKSALDFKETARNSVQIDRALEAGSRAVETITHRRFYPERATRYFDYPQDFGPTWRLWLDQNELVSVTSITSGGAVISNYFLEPANDGPPYDRIETNRGSSSVFSSAATSQRATAVTGVFGYNEDLRPVTSLAEALDAVEVDVDVADSSQCGVGALLTVGSEKMIVTGARALDTGLNLNANIDSRDNVVTIPFTGSGAVYAGERITIDAERMAVVDVVGSNLFAQRAVDGTVLASHTSGADIYAPRTLVVTRGVLGTTAATASLSAAVSRQVFPGLVVALCIAEAENTYLQESAGYARVSGEGEGARTFSQTGLNRLRDQTASLFGRQARTAGV